MVVHSYISNSNRLMTNQFYKFFITIFIIVSIFISIDVIVGRIAPSLLFHIGNVGQLGKTNYALYEVDTPILIVGSSRAAHHYDSKIIADSCNMTTYNIGRDGCFFTHNCCLINTILDRYTPELIIWEFGSDYLYDNEDPITSMYPYYKESDYITKTLNAKVNLSEQIKLQSSLYRYNSLFIRIAIRLLSRNNSEDKALGYEPLAPKELLTPLALMDFSQDKLLFNEAKVLQLSNSLEKAKKLGVKIILVTSPLYGTSYNSDATEKILSICKAHDANYIDNSSLYIEYPEYFNDNTHMNSIGAQQYTNEMIPIIKQYIND